MRWNSCTYFCGLCLPFKNKVNVFSRSWVSQRDAVYLGWPIAPLYMSPNAGGWGLRCLSQWRTTIFLFFSEFPFIPSVCLLITYSRQTHQHQRHNHVRPTHEGVQVSQRCAHHDQQGRRQPLRLWPQGEYEDDNHFHRSTNGNGDTLTCSHPERMGEANAFIVIPKKFTPECVRRHFLKFKTPLLLSRCNE